MLQQLIDALSASGVQVQVINLSDQPCAAAIKASEALDQVTKWQQTGTKIEAIYREGGKPEIADAVKAVLARKWSPVEVMIKELYELPIKNDHAVWHEALGRFNALADQTVPQARDWILEVSKRHMAAAVNTPIDDLLV